MTVERAKYILAHMEYGSPRYAFGGIRGGGSITHEDGITVAEDDYIRKCWKTLSGSSCYMSVVYEIANNRKFVTDGSLHLPE